MERLYNVPLRKEAAKAKRHERTKRAVSALRAFLARHMKSETVVLGPGINEKLWERGIKHPPHHIKVKATKDDDGTVRAELADGSEKQKKAKTEETASDAKTKKTSSKTAAAKKQPKPAAPETQKADEQPAKGEKPAEKETPAPQEAPASDAKSE